MTGLNSRMMTWLMVLIICLSIALDSQAAGKRLWVRRYGNLYAGADYVKGMAIDKDGNVVVVVV